MSAQAPVPLRPGRSAGRWQPATIAALQGLVGNSAVSRLVAASERSTTNTVQRDPGGPGPPPPVAQDAPLTGRVIDFATRPGTVAGVGVRVTGRLRLTGKASVQDAQLPEKSKPAAIGDRAAALLLAALNAAAPTGTNTRIEFVLAGKPLILELAAAPTGPAFQVTAELATKSGPLTVTGVEVTTPDVALSTTVWINPPAPTPAPAAPGVQAPAPTPTSVSDATVKSLGYAGALAVFSDDLTPNRRDGDGKPETIRTGSVSLKSTFDDIDSKLSADVKAGAMGFFTRDEQKLAWLQEMRAYFGTDDKTIDHFAKLRKVAIKGSTTIMHESAAIRLEAVQAELGAAVMPSSGGVGWPRSQCRLGGRAGLANLHNLGLAIDYNATQAPHIKDSRIKDLISVTTGRGPTANYPSTAGIDTRKVGETSTTGSDVDKGKVDQDAKVTQWLAGVETEATALGQASEDFRGSLKTTTDPNDPHSAAVDNGPRLVELRQRWHAAASKPKTERDTLRAAILAELPAVVRPWLDKIVAFRTTSQTELTQSGVPASTLSTNLTQIATAAVATDNLRKRARPALAAAAPSPPTTAAAGAAPTGGTAPASNPTFSARERTALVGAALPVPAASASTFGRSSTVNRRPHP